MYDNNEVNRRKIKVSGVRFQVSGLEIGLRTLLRWSFGATGNSCRKPNPLRYSFGGYASHVEMVARKTGFFAQSSVLSTHYLSIDSDTWTL